MKQKLRILTSLTFLVGVFVIVYAALAVSYYSNNSESQGLTSQVLIMRSALSKPLPNLAELQRKLDTANAASESLLASLPSAEQGIDVYGALVDLGNKGNVSILGIKSSPSIVRKEGSGTKTILPFSIIVKGSQEDALAFISSLIQGHKLLQGLEIRNVNVKSTVLVDGTMTADLDLHIHTWPGPVVEAPAAGPVSGSLK